MAEAKAFDASHLWVILDGISCPREDLVHVIYIRGFAVKFQ